MKKSFFPLKHFLLLEIWLLLTFSWLSGEPSHSLVLTKIIVLIVFSIDVESKWQCGMEVARNSLPVDMLTGQSNDGHRIRAWNVHVVREGHPSGTD